MFNTNMGLYLFTERYCYISLLFDDNMTGKVELLHNTYISCHISSSIDQMEVYIPLTIKILAFLLKGKS